MTIPRLQITAADPHARGLELGTSLRERIGATWAGYERLFMASGAAPSLQRSVGERSLERAREWAPPLAAEIDGIAAGAGLERWQAGALNARTEVLAAAGAVTVGECSTFVIVPPAEGGPPRTIQTWDWYEHLRDAMLLVELGPRPGHTVRLFTEAGIVGKVGVNGAGLGLHFNILHHAADGGEPGVPVHVVARRVLDDAASVEEATELARSAPVSASTVLTVVAWDGERASARCLELSPAGLGVLDPDAAGVLLHTNHFLDPALARGEQPTDFDSTTRGRLESLAQRIGALRAATGADARATALVDHESGICCHAGDDPPPDQRSATLATISLDVAAGHVHAHPGGPCAVTGDGAWERL
ncbi:MAG TPA: C45 family peptidase [Solirubrobacterales bacterium]|nr:C45 family peptidase [Solirubrobacterales bacterium]